MSARILVVDDILANVKLLEAKLSSEYYTVLTANDGIEALDVAARELPDLILLDVMMPRMDGFECCAKLKANPELCHIPVVMVTALDQPSDRVRGLEAGADDFLTKPANDLALFARVRSLVRVKMMIDELRLRDETCRAMGLEATFLNNNNSEPKGNVMIVDSRAVAAAGFCEELQSRLPVECQTAVNRDDALKFNNTNVPDVFIISQALDGYDGLRLCSELRSMPATRNSAIVMLVEYGDYESIASCLDHGANDYLMRPLDGNEMVARVRSQLLRKDYADRLRANMNNNLRMAMTDPLTGLYNRRYASQHMNKQLHNCRTANEPFAVVLLDLDRFKSVNDTYGHQAGDEVLKEFARRAEANLRNVDLIARIGGEEFQVAMPDTSMQDAMMVADRVRTAIAAKPFILAETGEALNITISAGVACDTPDQPPLDILISKADEALYMAKNSGRNKVLLSEAA